MPLDYSTIKVGMRIKCNYKGSLYPGVVRCGYTAVVVRYDGLFGSNVFIEWDDGHEHSKIWSSPMYFDEAKGCRKRKPRKVIPDIPIDTSMPILEAGYLQDRARKKFK